MERLNTFTLAGVLFCFVLFSLSFPSSEMLKKMGFTFLLIYSLWKGFLHNHNDFAIEINLLQYEKYISHCVVIQIIFNWQTTPFPSIGDCLGVHRELWSEERTLSLCDSSVGCKCSWCKCGMLPSLWDLTTPRFHSSTQHTHRHMLCPQRCDTALFLLQEGRKRGE